MKKQVIPTKEVIEAAKTVIQCRAIVQVLAPEIRKIQSDLLIEIGAKDEAGTPITEPNHKYLMIDLQWEVYYSKLHTAYLAAGHKVEQDHCPLLIAENHERQATAIMNRLAAACFLTGAGIKLNPDEIYGEDRKKLTDLNLSYISQFIKG